MQNLFTQTTQVEVLNFQTFTTEYVAERYGTSTANIRFHKKEHADELLENIHFITETNKFGTNETKWTLRGIIKLGMFIRSKEAKTFRLWAEQELEKAILKQAEDFARSKQKNLELVNKISDLEAVQISQNKQHQKQINGYKSQIAQHNRSIEVLKAKLVLKNDSEEREREYMELELTRAKNMFKNAVDDFLNHVYLVITKQQK